MENLVFFEQAGKLIGTYGLGLLIACTAVWLTYKYFSNLLEIHFEARRQAIRDKPPTLQELQDHRFFYRYAMMRTVDIRALEINSPIKQRIAMRALTIYWHQISTTVRGLLTQEFVALESSEANSRIVLGMSEAIDNAYETMLNASKMPSKAVEWLQRYRNQRERMLFMTLNVYLTTNAHPAIKLMHLLNMLHSDIDTAAYSISSAMNDLNGALECEEFDGVQGIFLKHCVEHNIPVEQCKSDHALREKILRQESEASYRSLSARHSQLAAATTQDGYFIGQISRSDIRTSSTSEDVALAQG